MCDFCEKEKILIEKEVLTNLPLHFKYVPKDDDTYKLVVFYDSRGYLRLADKDDCNCLDHEEKIKINFCPMCGKELICV